MSGGAESATFDQTLTGTFSSTSGLDIDPLSGEIDTNLSAVSTYTIEYTSVGVDIPFSSVNATVLL